ncbi:hypothetical protein M885DRAFT_501091 [Pelagophyceae sp. CCMP2097]|nr:hypothetical protein M885DRAFT_501091 [Pelagophyceae sp. CCMP2097]
MDFISVSTFLSDTPTPQPTATKLSDFDEKITTCLNLLPAPAPRLVEATLAPTPTPSDSEIWHAVGKPDKGCAWVAKDAALRCARLGQDTITAAAACAETCFLYESPSGESPFGPDSLSWYKNSSPEKDCTWVALNPGNRCFKRDSNDVTAATMCTASCGTLVSPTPASDSPSWHKSDRPEKDCAWVAANAKQRCSKRDSGDVSAAFECAASCGQCTDVWSKKGKPSKGCAWVSMKPETRCSKKDSEGSRASESCCGC